MDGLSGAAGVIAIVDISAKIFSACQTYFKEAKDARKDIQRLRDGVTSLQDVLTDIADLEEDSSSTKRTVFSRLTQHNGPVQQCEKELRDLLLKLEVGEGEDRMRRFGARALKWPFSSKEVAKRLEEIDGYKSTFMMALTSDNLALTRTINENVLRLGEGISEIQLEQKTLSNSVKQREIRDWLSAPDSSSNHNAACKSHQKDTGNWLIESEMFQEWRTQSSSFLWLHGIPGCGKSVLCSTVIEALKSQYKLDKSVTLVYYYFSFTDSEKQKHDKFVRSLVEQFAWQSAEAHTYLESLYSQLENGRQQPKINALESMLKHMIGVCKEAFIIIDALDECDPREDLLTFLEVLPSWAVNKLHILATSRKERDIEEVLDLMATKQISLQGLEVENDIQSYISGRLQRSLKLKRWPVKLKTEIEETLKNKAKGMFRWVVCQMDVLEKCVTASHLRNALLCLPETLDDTYDRVLKNIHRDEIYRQDAFRLFQWLVYSTRPLLLEELAEVLAVNIEQSIFDPENRISEPRDVLTICSSLVTIVPVTLSNRRAQSLTIPSEALEIRLAHFSVKEYLISDRIRTRVDFQYDIQSRAQDEITRTCLIYLLHFQEGVLTKANLKSFPLAHYAANYWAIHYRLLEELDDTEATTLALRLCDEYAFYSWVWITNPGPHDNVPGLQRDTKYPSKPLYYASHAGLCRIVIALLGKGADVNAYGGTFGTALHAASTMSDERMATLLLDNGTDVNDFGNYGSALYLASSGGNQDLIDLLLDRGADPNARGQWGTPLYAASEKGHTVIVALLLQAEALPDPLALFVAVEKGHTEIVALHLYVRTDPNCYFGYMHPLYSAISSGFREITSLLLDSGAKMSPYGAKIYYPKAIKTALKWGHVDTVALLLERKVIQESDLTEDVTEEDVLP